MRRALIICLLALSCASSQVVDTLYFGTSREGAPAVTDAEWQQFVRQVVTPRVPGFTVARKV